MEKVYLLKRTVGPFWQMHHQIRRHAHLLHYKLQHRPLRLHLRP